MESPTREVHRMWQLRDGLTQKTFLVMGVSVWIGGREESIYHLHFLTFLFILEFILFEIAFSSHSS
jgi:hypothetical protein